MKMVKSAFLASAAGLVAMSGAQAADLPVKAKPVEYVKVCSLYGAGFYYIPGTDICMKVGGYVRFQQGFGSSGNITSGPFTQTGSYNTRESSTDYQFRTRAIATFDTRQQTAYGTLRTYLILGFTNDSIDGATNSLYTTRAFIQIAGFTFGKATSFFDFVSTAAVAYNAGHTYSPDTGDAGHIVAAYTAQFGNGMSATISAEQARRRGVDYLSTAVNITTLQLTGAQVGTNTVIPTAAGALGADLGNNAILQDVVGNLRVDQAWGSAQIAAALHDASASYFGSGPTRSTLTENNGHPDAKWGWAVTGGLRLNAPMIGAGDYFQIAGVYAQGATKYASNTPTSTQVFSGQSVGFAIHNDGGFTGTAATGSTAAVDGIFQLTTAWSVFASYEHFWTPSLRTSLYGSYLNISRPDALNDAMCASGLYNLASVGQTRASGCNLDSSQWNIGTRTQWNVTKDLYVGVDVIYHKLNSGSYNAAGTAIVSAPGTAGKSGVYTTGDQDAFVGTWRIHRDIVP